MGIYGSYLWRCVEMVPKSGWIWSSVLGESAFMGFQMMMACHGMICEDRHKISMHGKDIAYGDGSAVMRNSEGLFP